MKARIQWDDLSSVLAAPWYDFDQREQSFIKILTNGHLGWVTVTSTNHGIHLPWLATKYSVEEATSFILEITSKRDGYFLIAWRWELGDTGQILRMAIANMSELYIARPCPPPDWFFSGCPFIDWTSEEDSPQLEAPQPRLACPPHC